jgi:hypothetical protein
MAAEWKAAELGECKRKSSIVREILERIGYELLRTIILREENLYCQNNSPLEESCRLIQHLN